MVQEDFQEKKSLAEASNRIDELNEEILNLRAEILGYRQVLSQIKRETAERHIGEMATTALETYRTWNDPV